MFRHVLITPVLSCALLVQAAQAAPSMDEAAKHNDVIALRTQLSAGADINKRYDIGRTAVMIAARYGKVATVEILAQAGADLNLQDNNGDTALHLAASYGHRPVVQALLKNNADFRIRNRSKLTAQENVEKQIGRFGSDPEMMAMADYLAKIIPTLPQPQSGPAGSDNAKPAETNWGEPALFVDYVTTNVAKYQATPATLQQAAKIALLQRGWRVLINDPERSIGSYTRKDTEYRVEILTLPANKVRIAFLKGYHNTNPTYLENLEKNLLRELELRNARK